MSNWAVKLAVGTDLNQQTPFTPQSVIIDNTSAFWLYLPDADRFIPPGFFGTVASLSQAIMARAQWIDPTTGNVETGAGTAYLLFTDEVLTPTGGGPTSVNISGGTVDANITNVGPISISGSVSISGTPAVTISGTPTVAISGTINANITAGTVNVQNVTNGTLSAATAIRSLYAGALVTGTNWLGTYAVNSTDRVLIAHVPINSTNGAYVSVWDSTQTIQYLTEKYLNPGDVAIWLLTDLQLVNTFKVRAVTAGAGILSIFMDQQLAVYDLPDATLNQLIQYRPWPDTVNNLVMNLTQNNTAGVGTTLSTTPTNITIATLAANAQPIMVGHEFSFNNRTSGTVAQATLYVIDTHGNIHRFVQIPGIGPGYMYEQRYYPGLMKPSFLDSTVAWTIKLQMVAIVGSPVVDYAATVSSY